MVRRRGHFAANLAMQLSLGPLRRLAGPMARQRPLDPVRRASGRRSAAPAAAPASTRPDRDRAAEQGRPRAAGALGAGKSTAKALREEAGRAVAQCRRHRTAASCDSALSALLALRGRNRAACRADVGYVAGLMLSMGRVEPLLRRASDVAAAGPQEGLGPALERAAEALEHATASASSRSSNRRATPPGDLARGVVALMRAWRATPSLRLVHAAQEAFLASPGLEDEADAVITLSWAQGARPCLDTYARALRGLAMTRTRHKRADPLNLGRFAERTQSPAEARALGLLSDMERLFLPAGAPPGPAALDATLECAVRTQNQTFAARLYRRFCPLDANVGAVPALFPTTHALGVSSLAHSGGGEPARRAARALLAAGLPLTEAVASACCDAYVVCGARATDELASLATDILARGVRPSECDRELWAPPHPPAEGSHGRGSSGRGDEGRAALSPHSSALLHQLSALPHTPTPPQVTGLGGVGGGGARAGGREARSRPCGSPPYPPPAMRSPASTPAPAATDGADGKKRPAPPASLARKLVSHLSYLALPHLARDVARGTWPVAFTDGPLPAALRALPEDVVATAAAAGASPPSSAFGALTRASAREGRAEEALVAVAEAERAIVAYHLAQTGAYASDAAAAALAWPKPRLAAAATAAQAAWPVLHLPSWRDAVSEALACGVDAASPALRDLAPAFAAMSTLQQVRAAAAVSACIGVVLVRAQRNGPSEAAAAATAARTVGARLLVLLEGCSTPPVRLPQRPVFHLCGALTASGYAAEAVSLMSCAIARGSLPRPWRTEQGPALVDLHGMTQPVASAVATLAFHSHVHALLNGVCGRGATRASTPRSAPHAQVWQQLRDAHLNWLMERACLPVDLPPLSGEGLTLITGRGLHSNRTRGGRLQTNTARAATGHGDGCAPGEDSDGSSASEGSEEAEAQRFLAESPTPLLRQATVDALLNVSPALRPYVPTENEGQVRVSVQSIRAYVRDALAPELGVSPPPSTGAL